MKKILFTLIISLLLTNFFSAQNVPIGMKYQAVARDLSGLEISNKPISLKILLHGELNTSNIYYVETHDITTNEFGLFSLCIGEGNVAQGKFDKIPWDKENIWMEIAIKEEGDKNHSTISNNKLLAVPYAYHANTAGYIVGSENQSNNGNGPQAGVPSQNWSLFGNSKSDPEKDKLGTTDLADLVMVTDNLERLRIFANGDINIKKSLSIDEDLTVAKNVYLNTVEGETVNNGPFTVTNQSPTLLTGELHVNGIGQFDSNINIDASTVTDKLVVSDEDIPNPTPRYGSLADVRGLFIADSIAIIGGLDIGGNLKVHGDSVIVDHHLLVGGSSLFKDQLTINANLSGGESNYDAYPLRVEGSNQGLAIKVNQATPNNGNNFISFFDNNNTVRGRIEGETTVDLLTNPEYIFDNSVFAVDILINSGELAVAIAEEGQALADQLAADTSVTNCTGAGLGGGAVIVNVTCIPIPSLIAASITDVVVKSANLGIAIANEAEAITLPVAYNLFKHTQIGVTYQSGAGDYAEWLPKVNLKSKFYPGDIVGVKAGKISKNTNDAEMSMVVSSNPIVLGNMPEEGTERLYEKIAFMGQVPVKVYGIVNEGDYILPSGNNDGFGIAVTPEKLNANDYQKIVGIAWTSSNSFQLNYVNVAVGLNANDLSRLVVKQEKRIEQQTSEMNELRSRLDKIDILLTKLDTGYRDTIKNSEVETSAIESPENGNYEENGPSITYTMVTEEQIEEGIKLAEERLRINGVDVDKHPLFMKLKSDPNYKSKYIAEILNGFNKEILVRSELDKESGIKVIIQ